MTLYEIYKDNIKALYFMYIRQKSVGRDMYKRHLYRFTLLYKYR